MSIRQSILKARRAWSDPSGYKPFHELELCSNRLVGVEFPFEIEGGVHPLMIGVGEKPRIWLAAPLNKKRKDWKFVIEDSREVHPSFSIEREGAKVLVKAGFTVVLQVEHCSAMMARVARLDLRPIGLDIFGDSSYMQVGSAYLVENVIHGGRSAITIAR